MSHPLNAELLTACARLDFLAEAANMAFAASLPTNKATLYRLGLYQPSFVEFEVAMGHRHPRDPRGDPKQS